MYITIDRQSVHWFDSKGICHTQYPESVVEMTMLYADEAFDELNMVGLSPAQRRKRLPGLSSICSGLWE